jgi:hypothetical protein
MRRTISTEEAYRRTMDAVNNGLTITATRDAKTGEWSHTWSRFPITTTIVRDPHGFTYLSVKNVVA